MTPHPAAGAHKQDGFSSTFPPSGVWPGSTREQTAGDPRPRFQRLPGWGLLRMR